MYNDQNGLDDFFNVIYIQLENESESNFDTKYPRNTVGCASLWALMLLIGRLICCMVLNFLLTNFLLLRRLTEMDFFEAMDFNLNFKEVRSSFPFIQADMTEVVRRQISDTHKWDLRRFHFPEYISSGEI